MNRRGPILLSRYLALAWCGLIVYASLHPLSGWRDTGISPFAFLEGGWPRYWTGFDLAANVAVYLPLGFFLTLAMRGLPGRYTTLVIAVLFSFSLSFSLETLQTWLPSRVPSNLDLICNTAGSVLGAVWAQMVGPRVFLRIAALEHYLVAPIPHAELGLTLLGLWLLVPLSPEILLFGAGDLRYLLGFSSDVPFVAESFVMIEASVTAFNAIAVGLLLRMLCVRVGVAYLVVPLFFILCLAVRTVAAAVLIGPDQALSWLTYGAKLGILVSGSVLVIAMALPSIARIMILALALMAGAVLVNLAPANPYSMAALATWRQGHFLNFNGLTRLAASLWPFVALPCLTLLGRRS